MMSKTVYEVRENSGEVYSVCTDVKDAVLLANKLYLKTDTSPRVVKITSTDIAWQEIMERDFNC